MNPKQRAAEAALAYIQDGMNVGLGTGSTTDFFLIALGEAIGKGKVRNIRGVPTSRKSEDRAHELGIPLTTLGQCPELDVTVDGADEVDPKLDLIKGLGGALLREKLVAQSSKKLVIIVDSGKVVTRLGTKSPLPVEVVQFAHETQDRYLRAAGAEPTLRKRPDGAPYVTDNGNYIYDCKYASGITDANKLADVLHHHAGIVESGLFLGMASVVLIASADGVEERKR
jgi:ribose 5-phosphate isomerase A